MDTKKRTIQLIIGPVLFAIASVALKGAIGGPGAMAIGYTALDGILVGNTASCTDSNRIPSGWS